MPDNDFSPKPIMFLNNPNAKQVVFFGQAINIKDVRDSTLYHFYLWDTSDFYNNIESYISNLSFAETLDEAQNTDLLTQPNFSYFSFESVINALNLDDNKLRYILYALFEVCSSDKNIYIINSCNDANTTTNNLYLMLLIFRIIPKSLICKLGFITYFKYIETNLMNTLNQNIKIRFVDNNKDNIKQEQPFLLDINNFNQSIRQSSYLDFLLNGLKGKDTNNFNTFLENIIKDFSKINFNLIEQLYNYNTNNIIQEDFLNVIILNFNIFENNFKTELINYIISKVTTYIHNNDCSSLVLKIYNAMPELRDIIIKLICENISTKKTKSLDILSNEFATKDFLKALNKKLFAEYILGSIFYFEYELKTKSLTKVLASIIVYEPAFLKEINTVDFFDFYIKQNILNLNFNEFANIALNNQKNMFTALYILSANYYIKTIIDDMLKNNDSNIKILEHYLNISLDLNKDITIITNKNYINYFNNLVYELFIERNKTLDELKNKLDLVFEFINNNSNTDDLKSTIKKYMTLLFRNISNEQSIQKLSTWSDEYITLTTNPTLIDKIYCIKATNEFDNYMKNKDYKCAKNVINNYYKNNIIVFDTLIECLATWYKNEFDNKMTQDNFDYGLFAFLFYELPETLVYILPNDDIIPLVQVMEVIDENFRHLKIKKAFHKKIINNKKLLSQFLKLNKSDQNLFGSDMVSLAQKNKHFKIYCAFDFFGTSLGFCINIFAIYLITVAINVLTQNKSYLVTGLFIIFGALFSFIFIIRELLKKDDKIKINLVILIYFIILSSTIYLLVIDSPNKDNNMLNTCKKIFFINYDFQNPEIEVIYNTLLDPPTGETIKNIKSPDLITLNEDQIVNLQIKATDNNKINEFTIMFDNEMLELKNNIISLDMSKYSASNHMLKLYAIDEYDNKATTEINFVVNKIDKEIYTDLHYAVSKTDIFDVLVPLKDNDIITLEPKNNFRLNVTTKSIAQTTIKIFLNNKLLTTSKDNLFFYLKYNNILDQNKITIEVTSFYNTKKFNIKLNK